MNYSMEADLSDLTPLLDHQLDDFFNRCVDDVAKDLIGMFLFNQKKDSLVGGEIIETEAYCENDPAAHCYVGTEKRPQKGPPPRRMFDSMYRPAGHVYVFPRWCLNLVCGPDGFGSGVLVRALRPTCGLPFMRQRRETQRRAAATNDTFLCERPENLCQALQVTGEYDGKKLCETTLRLFARDSRCPNVKCGPRINIPKNNAAAHWPRGYILDDSSVAPYFSPEVKRIANRETFPPALLRELKTGCQLKDCRCSV